ncbi:hypothetical protein DOTSEDRAFT_69091 [Dothistroma septosporum NZE10]|uniref:Uncharacterized protein n=1 Tax=Dothistroma septosporum (strain NZE10 / CBS 128990) TaxID=675120 RepID=N1PXN3_DOTSN|nr:hypothetical protein DOTSEDRAFT_69091 [Dothistroma septosporum NZE10]
MPFRLAGVVEGIAEYGAYAVIGLMLAVGAVPLLVVISSFSIAGVSLAVLYILYRVTIFMISETFLALRHRIWDPRRWPPSSKIDRQAYRRRQSLRSSEHSIPSRHYAKPRSRRQSHSRMDSVTGTTFATSESATPSRSATIASFASNEDRDFGDLGGWAGPNEDNEALYMARHNQAFSGLLLGCTESPTQQTPIHSRRGSLDSSPIASRSSSRAPITSEYSGFQNQMRPRRTSNEQTSPRKINTPYGPQTPNREGFFDFGGDGSTSFSAGGSITPTSHESRSTLSLNDRQSRSRRSSFYRRSANLSTTSLGQVPEGRPVGGESTLVGSPLTDEDGLRAMRRHVRSATVR